MQSCADQHSLTPWDSPSAQPWRALTVRQLFEDNIEALHVTRMGVGARQAGRISNLLSLGCLAEGRVYVAYQGLEARLDDTDGISQANLVNNFKDFITKAEPQWDVEKKNQLFYQ